MDKDTVVEATKEIIERFSRQIHPHKELWDRILFVTGRPEKYRNETLRFMNERVFDGLSSWDSSLHKLFMRPDFRDVTEMFPTTAQVVRGNLFSQVPDNRPAHEVKREIFERKIKDKYEVLFALESCDDCISMYQELGVTTMKVGLV